MGSLVSLTVGGIEIDWGKNFGFINHAKLFQPADRKILSTDDEDGVSYERFGYSRKLKDVVPRLELYGYSLGSLKRIYQQHEESYPDYYAPLEIPFESFAAAVKNITISKRKTVVEEHGYDLGRYAEKLIYTMPEYADLASTIGKSSRQVMEFFENLAPYIQLRLLAENPENADLDVEWHTSDIIEGGYTSDEDLFKEWSDSPSFLIITEGSSDTFIIREAIAKLRPDIKDFFKYIDMTEHYPFSGTGNLYNFYKGLARIGIENRCLVIFDNDTEGIEKNSLCEKIKAPNTLSSTTLPRLECFEKFKTLGPNGEFLADINGRGVSIECFLDLTYKSRTEPKVRWTNFKENMDSYQGSLEGKEFYIAQFKKALTKSPAYDFNKLTALIDHIYDCCINMVDRTSNLYE